MPVLLRLLVAVLVLAGLGLGGMFALVRFVEPEQRDITASVPPSRFNK